MRKVIVRFLHLLLVGVMVGGIASCDSCNAQKRSTYDTLVFNVDKTRLEPAITDATLKMKMSAPKGWNAIDDSTVAQVIDELGDKLAQGLQMMPRWVFVNEGTGATCVVSWLKGVNGTPDDTVLESLETAYHTEFPKATIQRSIFMKGAFRVDQLMVVTSDFVLIKLICSNSKSPVIGIDYAVPPNVYEAELRSIESSIGSITLLTN